MRITRSHPYPCILDKSLWPVVITTHASILSYKKNLSSFFRNVRKFHWTKIPLSYCTSFLFYSLFSLPHVNPDDAAFLCRLCFPPSIDVFVTIRNQDAVPPSIDLSVTISDIFRYVFNLRNRQFLR